MVQMLPVTPVWSSAWLLGQVSRVIAGCISLQSHRTWNATDTSRFLHQAPRLPRMELVVGCLEHLFYVAHQLKERKQRTETFNN